MVSWIPIGVVSSLICDLVATDIPIPPVFNVVHPHRTSWRDMWIDIRDALGVNIPFVPLHKWMAKVEAKSVSPSTKTMTDIVSKFCNIASLMLTLLKCSLRSTYSRF